MFVSRDAVGWNYGKQVYLRLGHENTIQKCTSMRFMVREWGRKRSIQRKQGMSGIITLLWLKMGKLTNQTHSTELHITLNYLLPIDTLFVIGKMTQCLFAKRMKGIGDYILLVKF